jgi:hypothetical protein
MSNGPLDPDQLTFSWAGRHVSHLALPASGEDWLTLVATWPSPISLLLTGYVPSGSSGRTSPASCHRAEDGTLVPSSGRWANSGMGSPTECWTLNGSEWPSAAVVCSLSDTLETGAVPQRFFLSARACAGILRRAEKRGKELPSLLRAALEATAKDAGRYEQMGATSEAEARG